MTEKSETKAAATRPSPSTAERLDRIEEALRAIAGHRAAEIGRILEGPEAEA